MWHIRIELKSIHVDKSIHGWTWPYLQFIVNFEYPTHKLQNVNFRLTMVPGAYAGGGGCKPVWQKLRKTKGKKSQNQDNLHKLPQCRLQMGQK